MHETGVIILTKNVICKNLGVYCAEEKVCVILDN